MNHLIRIRGSHWWLDDRWRWLNPWHLAQVDTGLDLQKLSETGQWLTSHVLQKGVAGHRMNQGGLWIATNRMCSAGGGPDFGV